MESAQRRHQDGGAAAINGASRDFVVQAVAILMAHLGALHDVGYLQQAGWRSPAVSRDMEWA